MDKNENESLKTLVATAGIYFLLFWLSGALIPFFPLWLDHQGLSPDQIGIVVSLSFLPKLIGNPLIAHIADSTGKANRLIVALLLYSVTVYLCYFFADEFVAILLLTLAAHFGTSPLGPLMDRVSISIRKNGRDFYGNIRLWGSTGFALSALCAGYIVSGLGVAYVMTIPITILTISIFASRYLPVEKNTKKRVERQHLGDPPLVQLIRRPELLAVIVASAIIQSSNGFLYSFSSIYWQQRGYTTFDISVFWGVGIGFEIIFFFISNRVVDRLGALPLIMLSGIFSGLRWFVLGMTDTREFILLAQILQCFTISGNVSAIMAYIRQNAGAGYKTTAIAMYTTLAMGVFIFGS